jgi:hypothetical protein
MAQMDSRETSGLTIYTESQVSLGGSRFFLAQESGEPAGRRVLGIVGNAPGFVGERRGDTLVCPLTPENAAALRAVALRERLPWLRPHTLGLQTSAGCGDRLGLATPGHVHAARKFETVAPIFAQQSVRENTRTGRTPQQVMDDAMWGLFQEGWRRPWGSDADHLKTPEDVDSFAAAGFTLYTIDPGDHVDGDAHTAPPADVGAKVQALPWDALEDALGDMERRYLGRSFDVGDLAITLDREALHRAAAKYGRAVAHTVAMYRHLVANPPAGSGFELEVSVDETETPTSPEEHLYVASELKRLGVEWVSLAPRYVGRFEKGVDYIGDLDVFKAELAKHAAIARALGPYKLSIHSGSDKFSIYPLIADLTDGLVHLKTAGTSYLEALRTIAQVDPSFFREILALARERYETDRATYHVSAELARVPPQEDIGDTDLPGLLDQFDARQVLHVTFGSVLDRFGDRLLATLAAHERVYAAMLETHFERHLSPFAAR